MLHEIGVDIAARLAAKGCPIKVVDGPEPTESTAHTHERIVIEHDGDAFSFARSQHRNPRAAATRNIGGKITIYANSPSPGALDWEHTRRAEVLLDMVLVALRYVSSVRKNGLTLKAGRFVKLPDQEKSDKQAGAVYELTFSIERAVVEKTWAGAIRPEATIGPGGITITNTDEITDPAHSTPETAC